MELVIIGFFCWWSVNQVKVSRVNFQELLSSVGLDYDFSKFGNPVYLQRSSFLKAVREVKGQHKEFLIRKIKKTNLSYTFGLVDESINEQEKHLNYSHSATMDFNPVTGQLTCDKQHRAFREIELLYQEYTNMLNSDDVRTILLDIISSLKSVSVRARGGIYFIPVCYKEVVEKLEVLLEKLPGDNYFAVAPQIDTLKSKQSIFKAFIYGLKEKLAKFHEELEEDGLTRKHALENRVQEIKQVKEEIEFYKSSLNFQVEDLNIQLEKLDKKVQSKLV